MTVFEAHPGQVLHLLSARLSDRPDQGFITDVVAVAPDVPAAVVQRAWTRLLQRFSGLRLAFHERDNGFVQEIRDLADLPPGSIVVGADPGDALVSARRDAGGLIYRVHHALVDAHALALVGEFLRRQLNGISLQWTDDAPAVRAAAVGLTAAAAAAVPAATAFWRTVPAAAREPLGILRAATGTGATGRQLVVDLPEALTLALRPAAARLNASVPILVHAALLAALHRLGGADAPVVGVPMTLRDHPAVGFDAVGAYLTVVPSIVEVDPDRSSRDVVTRVRDHLVALQEHKFLPLPQTARLLNLSAIRNGGGRSYFDLVLAVRDDRQAKRPDGAALAVRQLTDPGAPLNLELILGDTSGVLLVNWRDGLIPWPPAERLAGAIVAALTATVERPDHAVGTVPLLDPSAAADVVRLTNGAPGPLPALEPLADELLRIIARKPDSPAVSDSERDWTFGEYGAAVAGVVALLRSRGVRPGGRIGVAFGRSRWQLVGALAAWLEGLCYVPLDAGGPVERLRYVVADADIELVFAPPELAGRLGDTAVTVVGPADVTDAADLPTAGRAGLDSPAYVMYTSGTSGRPKGVLLTHRNLASFLAAVTVALPGLRPGRWLAETAPTFDISVLEQFWPLRHAQPVLLSGPHERSDRPGRDRSFAHRQCTPSRARQLLLARATGDPSGHWRTVPRTWLLGGERLPADLLASLREAYPETAFVNMYGPTEATIWSTCHIVTGAETTEVPLGVPLTNTSVWVGDADGRPVPEGVTAELYILGDGLSPGYVNRERETTERFVTVVDPRTGHPARAYRSGDLAAVGPDGRLYFKGRRDDQVKIRGHRIEPSEVEDRLLRTAGVREAFVTPVDEDDPAKTRLLAAVVLEPGRTPDPDRIRRSLMDHLPPPYLPSRIAVVDALPRLPSGKTDRVAARKLCEARVVGAGPDEPLAPVGSVPAGGPADPGPLEIVLHLAGRVLGQPVTAADNFFDRGGNSLLALQLVGLLRAQGWALDVEEVFEQLTLCDLAATTTTGPRTEA